MNFVAIIGIVNKYDKRNNLLEVKVEKHLGEQEDGTDWYIMIKTKFGKSEEFIEDRNKLKRGIIIGIKGFISGDGIVEIEKLQVF